MAGSAVHLWECVYDLRAVDSSHLCHEPFVPSEQSVSSVAWHGSLYDAYFYVKYISAGKCRRKICDDRVPSRQTIHNLVNKLREKGLLIENKTKHKHRVLTEEKLGDTEAKFQQHWNVQLKRQEYQSLVHEAYTL
jgi:hypothetical protein